MIGRLGVSHARGVMDERAYGEAVRLIQTELASVDDKLLEVQAADMGATRAIEELRSAAERIEQLWDVMTPLEQRAVLSTVPPRVEVRRAQYRGEPMAQRLVRPDE